MRKFCNPRECEFVEVSGEGLCEICEKQNPFHALIDDHEFILPKDYIPSFTKNFYLENLDTISQKIISLINNGDGFPKEIRKRLACVLGEVVAIKEEIGER